MGTHLFGIPQTEDHAPHQASSFKHQPLILSTEKNAIPQTTCLEWSWHQPFPGREYWFLRMDEMKIQHQNVFPHHSDRRLSSHNIWNQPSQWAPVGIFFSFHICKDGNVSPHQPWGCQSYSKRVRRRFAFYQHYLLIPNQTSFQFQELSSEQGQIDFLQWSIWEGAPVCTFFYVTQPYGRNPWITHRGCACWVRTNLWVHSKWILLAWDY